MIDHGAGIGMMSLCVYQASSGRIKRVVCSEAKRAFVANGRRLWGALGCGDAVEYQEGSALDFAYPGQVGVVLVSQMLYRIPPAKRRDFIARAWEALEPGGALLINELTDRDPATGAAPILRSEELFGCLPAASERWLFAAGTTGKPVPLRQAAQAAFAPSDNIIALRK